MSKLLDSVRSRLPADWDEWSEDLELVELGRHDADFKEVRSMMGEYRPSRVIRVENPFLWGCYQLKREECTKRWSGTTELDMWHVTDPACVDSIAGNNFDWRLAKRFKFGRGVCFSPDLEHAMRYCTRDGAVILARVLVGRDCPGSYSNKIPPPPCDSTTGWNKNVYVKYDDHEFYPAFVAYL